MWKCVKCGIQNLDEIKVCQCGFDQTMNYMDYKTLTPLPSDYISELFYSASLSSEFKELDFCYQRLKEILKACSEEKRKIIVGDLCMYFQDLQSKVHYQNITMVGAKNNKYKIGDSIKFGKYWYRILDIKEDKLFIICTELVNHYQFPETFFEHPIVWKDSILRTWLNKDFYETFTAKEQERICEVLIHTNDDTFTVVKEWNGKSYTKTVSGGPDTKDKIFLLSDEEVIKYLDSINDRIIEGEWWYLRTPARDVYVGSVDFNGDIDLEGEKCCIPVSNDKYKDVYGGIRPAMWILSEKNNGLLEPVHSNTKRNMLMSDEGDDDFASQYVLGSCNRRNEIVEIIFLNSFDNKPDDSWDVSADGSGEVQAWIIDKKLYIAAEGKIKASSCLGLFDSYNNLKNIDFNNCFDTSCVTDMSCMFSECKQLKNVDMSGFDTSRVTDMTNLFSDCESLETVDVSGFDTSKVTDMSWMFSGCKSLETVDVSGFDTSNVIDMTGMFFECLRLKWVNIERFNISKLKFVEYMFDGCKRLNKKNILWLQNSKY